jgi:hypothetical protein
MELLAVCAATAAQTVKFIKYVIGLVRARREKIAVPAELRQGLLPSNGAEWRRIVIGYGAVLVALFFLLAGRDSAPKKTNNSTANTAPSSSGSREYDVDRARRAFFEAEHGDELRSQMEAMRKLQEVAQHYPEWQRQQQQQQQQPGGFMRSPPIQSPPKQDRRTGEPCWSCGGLGKVMRDTSYSSPSGSGPVQRYAPCPVCGGSGQL